MGAAVLAGSAEACPVEGEPAEAGERTDEVTTEELVIELKTALPGNLVSVVLYGSTVAGDRIEDRSDFNVLVVTERLEVKDLEACSGLSRKWMKSGNPAPLFFTRGRLADSCDVFPIEFLDIKDSHAILYGQDVVSGLAVSYENLRLQIESEFKEKLIYLRERFLVTGGRKKAVLGLMVESLASILVLCRAALRLFEDEVPPRKLDAAERLSRYIRFETNALVAVQRIKEGVVRARQVDASALFAKYLATIETLADAVDRDLHHNSDRSDSTSGRKKVYG